MRERLDALYILVQNACYGCEYRYMSGDCIVDSCAVNQAFWTIKDFIEEMSYDKD